MPGIIHQSLFAGLDRITNICFGHQIEFHLIPLMVVEHVEVALKAIQRCHRCEFRGGQAADPPWNKAAGNPIDLCFDGKRNELYKYTSA